MQAIHVLLMFVFQGCRTAGIDMATRFVRERRRVLPTSSIQLLSLDRLETAPVRLAVNYWRLLRSGNNLPARSQLSPRDMAGILRNIILVRVIEGGSDYEYRIVGDAHVEVFGANFNKLRSSDVERISPAHGAQMRQAYEYVRSRAQPFAVRGWLGREIKDALFIHHETVFLPLGEDHVTVDHILLAGMYVSKPPD